MNLKIELSGRLKKQLFDYLSKENDGASPLQHVEKMFNTHYERKHIDDIFTKKCLGKDIYP
jgi:hypothetical protein